jgi:hypothetical protein
VPVPHRSEAVVRQDVDLHQGVTVCCHHPWKFSNYHPLDYFRLNRTSSWYIHKGDDIECTKTLFLWLGQNKSNTFINIYNKQGTRFGRNRSTKTKKLNCRSSIYKIFESDDWILKPLMWTSFWLVSKKLIPRHI